MKTKFLSLLLVLVASSLLGFASVSEDQFRFISNQDGSSVGLAQISTHQTLEYSLDGNIWSNMTTETTISLNNDITLYVRGKLSDDNSELDYTQFAITGSIEAKGNINYLWDYENPYAPLKKCCGLCMFKSCSDLISIPDLPATELASSCYQDMFRGCTSITKIPTLPATTLASMCYCSMFHSCSGLTTAVTLPATTLADSCYWCMFKNCTGLIKTPDLPATTLTPYCYYSMFCGCSSLTAGTVLPATTLAQGCYGYMFRDCSSLTKAPALPALKLVENCYNQMFRGCSRLNYIKCLATNISAENCTADWVKNVASSGTFVTHKSMSSWTTGVNGKPSGWSTSTVTPYTVFFDANGGIIPTDGNMGSVVDNQITYLSLDCKTGYVIVSGGLTVFSKMRDDCPTRDGYSFLGWYTSKTGGEQVYDVTGWFVTGNYWDADGKWKGTSNLQLYAHWQAETYIITWLNDDGTFLNNTVVQYGQIPTHAIPTKEPTAEYTYEFSGWIPEVVPVTGDATYTATYKAKPIATDIPKTMVDSSQQKVIRHGQIFILRGDKVYTVDGRLTN